VFDAGKQLSDSRWLARCLESWAVGRFEIAINHVILPENEWVVARFAVHYSEKAPADRHGAICVAGHLFVPPLARHPRPIRRTKCPSRVRLLRARIGLSPEIEGTFCRQRRLPHRDRVSLRVLRAFDASHAMHGTVGIFIRGCAGLEPIFTAQHSGNVHGFHRNRLPSDA